MSLALAPGSDFPAFLDARLPLELPGVEHLRALHAEDLALAWACLRGDSRALARLSELLKEATRQVGRGVRGVDLDDLQQAVLQKMIATPEGRTPKLVQYQGRGPLQAWLRAVAAREAVSALRRTRNANREEEVEERAVVAPDAELQFIRARYREPFKASFRAAIEGLPREERKLLRLHFVENLSHEQIAKLERVHQSTVTRRLAATRARLLEHIQGELASRLQVSGKELQSLVRAVGSDFNMSLGVLLSGTRK